MLGTSIGITITKEAAKILIEEFLKYNNENNNVGEQCLICTPETTEEEDKLDEEMYAALEEEEEEEEEELEEEETNQAEVTMEIPVSGASQEGRNLLMEIETLRLTPYNDQTGQAITEWVEGATIGYGHLISRSEWETYQNGITEEQAITLFNQDLQPFENAVENAIAADLTQQQFDALTILAFNIGVDGFNGSTVVQMINDPTFESPQYDTLDDAWGAWNRSQGREMQGLTNRRNAELDIYNNGVYERW